VLDNLMVGRHRLLRYGLLASLLYFGPARREEDRHRRRVEDVIDFLGLSPYRHQVAGRLPYGVQKRVELGRALAAEPALILLDEPMAGMNLEETEDMARYILDINEEWGVTVLLVEHDMGVVMDISDSVVVLDFGSVLAQGTPEEVQKNPEVVRAYLGDEDSQFLGR
jgi:branched-chain amino acid transport system ATP-binding protein